MRASPDWNSTVEVGARDDIGEPMRPRSSGSPSAALRTRRT